MKPQTPTIVGVINCPCGKHPNIRVKGQQVLPFVTKIIQCWSCMRTFTVTVNGSGISSVLWVKFIETGTAGYNVSYNSNSDPKAK